MADAERYPVLVSDAERAKVKTALTRYRDKLDGERKRLTNLEVATDDVDEVLSVVKGDGVSGGLLTRFEPRYTRDMFEKEPSGTVRQLHDPDPEPVREDFEDEDEWRKAMDAYAEDGAAVTRDPLYPDRWERVDDVLDEVERAVEESAGHLLYYLEDQDGDVWRVNVDVSVGITHVGRRPDRTVDQAVADAEEAEGMDRDEVEGAKLGQLRRLAVRIIEDEATDLEVSDRQFRREYAMRTDDRQWLKAWADGEQPQVPDDWTPETERQVLGTPGGLDDIAITPTARKLAGEHGIGAEDLVGRGTGARGRVVKSDVEDLISELISRAAQEVEA